MNLYQRPVPKNRDLIRQIDAELATRICRFQTGPSKSEEEADLTLPHSRRPSPATGAVNGASGENRKRSSGETLLRCTVGLHVAAHLDFAFKPRQESEQKMRHTCNACGPARAFRRWAMVGAVARVMVRASRRSDDAAGTRKLEGKLIARCIARGPGQNVLEMQGDLRACGGGVRITLEAPRL